MNKKLDEHKIKIAYAVRNFGLLYLMFLFGCLIWKLFKSNWIIDDSVKISFVVMIGFSLPVLKFCRLLKNNNGEISILQALLSIADFDIAICLTLLCGCLLERDLNSALVYVLLVLFCYGLRCFFVHRFSNTE